MTTLVAKLSTVAATGRTTMKAALMPTVNNNGASTTTERIPFAGPWVTYLEIRYAAEAPSI
jgi:hypothetical protein